MALKAKNGGGLKFCDQTPERLVRIRPDWLAFYVDSYGDAGWGRTSFLGG